MNIALIGMMGSMKSSVAKELAAVTGMPSADTDDIFASENRISIAKAFVLHGEEFFRQKETEIITRLTKKDGQIISCGGGLPLARENRATLSGCCVIWLTASASVIYSRLKNDKTRPLLQDKSIEKIERLIEERTPVYAECADITVDTDGRLPREIAKECLEIIKQIP